ncbi:hypothetical protein [Streptomyces sp. NPDC007070]|uniref:hypothetical protein n=1 Tax=Streptomyces sp. NPDC007070 TaxID=3154312 RepID=UPI0033D3FA87
MRIDLPSEIFKNEQSLPDLLYLLRAIADGRHDWVVSPDVIDQAERFFATHVPKLARTYAELAEKSMVAAVWSGQLDSAATVRVEADKLDDYVADLCRPALIVVEDETSDGYFLRAIARSFGAKRVLEALAKGWLELQHGGGGSLLRITSIAVGKYRVQPRVIALLDSDRMIPNQTTDSHRKAEQIQKLGINTHVLQMREAENYAPNRVLITIGRRKEAHRKLTHLKKLSKEQRDHYDMKLGFGPEDKQPRIPQDQVDLYKDLDISIILGLRGGFGKNILSKLEEMSPTLTSRDFDALGEDVSSELRSLLNKISSVI